MNAWHWAAVTLVAGCVIAVMVLRWLGNAAAAGARHDAVMAGPHATKACECEWHESCFEDWCDCDCHVEFSLGRADRPPSDPGDPQTETYPDHQWVWVDGNNVDAVVIYREWQRYQRVAADWEARREAWYAAQFGTGEED